VKREARQARSVMVKELCLKGVSAEGTNVKGEGRSGKDYSNHQGEESNGLEKT